MIGVTLISQEIASYDAYNHMFFAKHYRDNWFSLTDYQTGGGLDMRSYPPFVFQLLAVMSVFFGYENSYRILMVISWIFVAIFASRFFRSYSNLTDLPFWVLFTTIFFNIGLLKSIFIFGQLTTVVGFMLGFAALDYYHRFLGVPTKRDFVLFLVNFSMVMFSHHFSSIVVGIVLFFMTFMEFNRLKMAFRPYVPVYLFVFLVVAVAGLWPFIALMMEDNSIPGVEIPHSSRYPMGSQINYERWILTTYGLSGIFILFPLVWKRLKANNFVNHFKLYIIALILFLFSLGRSTPINKYVFGTLEHWLTYDRFSLMSSLFLTSIMVAVFYQALIRSKLNIKMTSGLMLFFYMAVSLGMLNYSEKIFSVYPEDANSRFNTNTILNFLNHEADVSYRYQTFGYGSQVSVLFLKSNNPTLDTNYFTGQKLAWVRESGIAEIDTVKHFGNVGFIDVFLNKSSEYSVRYIITLDDIFLSSLENRGWKRIKEKNNVIFWENPDEIEPVQKSDERVSTENYLWGIVPMLNFTFLLLCCRRS